VDSGWHPDPSGKHELRFVDGERWTDHVASGGQKGRDPMPVADPFSSTPHPPEPRGPFAPGPFAPGPNLFAWAKGNRAIKEMESQPHTIWTVVLIFTVAVTSSS
jgi:hypothetical protein